MHDLITLLNNRIDAIEEEDFSPEVEISELIGSQIRKEYMARVDNEDDPTEYSELELESMIASAQDAIDYTTSNELKLHIRTKLSELRTHINTMAEHRSRD